MKRILSNFVLPWTLYLLAVILVLLPDAGEAQSQALPKCNSSSSTADFDFIVVGAGAGGGPLAARLAETGYTVLVVDAGHTVFDFNTTIPVYGLRATEDPQIELNYTVSDYPKGFRFQKDDWYPRSRALGGCTVHNGLVNWIGGTKEVFDGIANKFEDSSWTRTNMQEYFKLIERNLYIPPPNPDHGYNGWMTTITAANQSLGPNASDPTIIDIVTAWASSGPPISDPNSLAETSSEGFGTTGTTIDANYTRYSVRDRLLDVASRFPQRLQFAQDTLATKVLTCIGAGNTVSAYGVEIVPGGALPVASNFHGKQILKTKSVTARHEVIVSAGTLQSPQLLMLSGIGPQDQLSKFGINTIVNLSGVGNNFRDNDEISTIWALRNNVSGSDCPLLSDPQKDPCLAEWIATGHRTTYSAGGQSALLQKSSANLSFPDMFQYFGPYYFAGFIHGYPQPPGLQNFWTVVSLKGPSHSIGYVRLTGSHPQDTLEINKNRFQTPESQQDVVDMRESIKRARSIMALEIAASHVMEELAPGPTVQTDEEIEDYIYQNAFGHHACCTNSIGLKDDPNAVLDNEFKVYGVNNLRVVDASSWPELPGYYTTTPTYMISEKAAANIIQSAKMRR